MRYFMSIVSAAILFVAAVSAWSLEVSPATADKLRRLEERAAAQKIGKPGEYAKDPLNEAVQTISAAQAAASVGNSDLALQKAELADLQLTLADAKASEMELVEQVAVQRVELKKLEAQLERYLQGEEK
jgi:hypothetical protein